MTSKHAVACAAFLALAMCLPSTQAASITGMIRIEVSNAEGSGSVEIDPSSGQWNGDRYSWSLGEDMALKDASNGATIATVMGDTAISAVADPVLTLNFNLTAGNSATNVTVDTAELNFSALNNPQALASAGIVLIDANGNGASYTGNFGGLAYRSAYNGALPGGTVFADLVGNATVLSPFGVMSVQDEYPAGGAFDTIAGAVSSMDAQFSFTLSARDILVGNSVFVVIPEPSSLVLAIFCGLVVASATNRKRRASA